MKDITLALLLVAISIVLIRAIRIFRTDGAVKKAGRNLFGAAVVRSRDVAMVG